MSKIHVTSDLPEEAELVRFFAHNQIRYVRPDREKGMVSTLDFYLPDYGVSIEVKAWSTERIHTQIERSGEDGKVIVLVGLVAVHAFILLCTNGLGRSEK